MSGADRLVLGTVQLGRPYGVANRSGVPSADEAVAILRAAERAGVGAIDCAPSYGDAELLVGRAGLSTPVFTKVSRHDDVATSVQASLERLRRSRIDILFLHDPEVVEDDPDNIVGRAHSLIGGPVVALGASVYTQSQFDACIDDDRITAVQVPMSAADPRLVRSGSLARAAAAGKAVYARSVFLQGALLLDDGTLPEHLRSVAGVATAADGVAKARRVPRSEILAVFVRDVPGVTGLVLGCETMAQLESNLTAVGAPPLDDAERAAIEGAPMPAGRALDPRRWPGG